MCKRAVLMPLSDPMATGIYICYEEHFQSKKCTGLFAGLCGKCGSLTRLLRVDMQYDFSGKDQANEDEEERKSYLVEDEKMLEVEDEKLDELENEEVMIPTSPSSDTIRDARNESKSQKFRAFIQGGDTSQIFFFKNW